MKRFYKHAAAVPGAGGHTLHLDGRPVKTPARRELVVPTQALAEAIAAEWEAQGETIDPGSMPLTGLANAALDRVAPEQTAFAEGLARYGESDLLCYRADGPERLVALQAAHWDPILAWARDRYGAGFHVTSGILHKPQPAEAVGALAAAIAARTAFELAGLSPLVTVSGSLLLALALAEQAIDLESAWEAAALEDHWQAEKWGEDAEAAAALANRRRDFEAGALFLDLLR